MKPLAPSPAARFQARESLLALCLALLAVAACLPALRAGFIWDDDHYVTQNQTLLSVAGLRQIWLDPRATPQYYPLVHTTFWLEHAAWGLSPLGYHLDNLLLHSANAVLAWLVFRRLGLGLGAWVAAALFAVHPVHVESVAWVTERKNLLSGFFFLAAALAWLRFENEPHRRRRWYAGAFLLFVAALLSKTVTCSLPAVLLVLAWWQRGRVTGREVARLAPFFAVGAVLGLQTAWLEKAQVGATGPEWALSFADRVLIAGRALWFYAGKLACPQPVTFIYPRWEIDAGVAWQWLFPAAALGAALVLWRFRARIGRGPVAAVVAFALMLFPALGFVNTYPMRYSFVADHFQYLASLALLALAGAGLARLPSRVRRVAVPAILVTFCGLSAWQCGAYRTPETLWRDTLDKNPGAVIAHNNLALLLMDRGRDSEAASHLAAALALSPDDYEVQTNTALLLVRTGRVDAAIAHYRAALAVAPRFPPAHNGLGNALVLQAGGQAPPSAEALAEFRAAARYAPRSPAFQYNLGLALARAGQGAEAIPHLRVALRLSPGDTAARAALLAALHRSGTPEALREAAAVERLTNNP